MNNKMYIAAAKLCKEVYLKNICLEMGTEYNYSIQTICGRRMQVITIAGTNDLVDCVKNINMLSWDGIKLSSYLAARRIKKDLYTLKHIPILVTGHSLGATVAIAYNRMYKADYCVGFSVPRCLRYWTNRKMAKTTIFLDPDDIIPKLGCLSFGLPKCKTIRAPENHFLFSFEDHGMQNWVEYTQSDLMPGAKK